VQLEKKGLPFKKFLKHKNFSTSQIPPEYQNLSIQQRDTPLLPTSHEEENLYNIIFPITVNQRA